MRRWDCPPTDRAPSHDAPTRRAFDAYGQSPEGQVLHVTVRPLIVQFSGAQPVHAQLFSIGMSPQGFA